MDIIEIKRTIQYDEAYSFLRTHRGAGENIILLGLGGSYSYGTNIETSDIDIRGITMPTKRELLLGSFPSQYTDNATDTVIYSLPSFFKLLINCNPNIIELLFEDPKTILFCSKIGQKLIDNRKMFLSQKAYYSFGGYAFAQLRKLKNASTTNMSQKEQNQTTLDAVVKTAHEIKDKYFPFSDRDIQFSIDTDQNGKSSLLINANLNKYPLKDLSGFCAKLNNVFQSYTQSSHRNTNAINHGKINKHAMHLIRLMYYAIDILENGDFCTYCTKHHYLLMDIRNGKYQQEDGRLNSAFFDLVNQLQSHMDYSFQHTQLPKKVDIDAINNLQLELIEEFFDTQSDA